MGKICHIVMILALASCAVVKRKHFVVLEYSEARFLYRDVQRSMNETNYLNQMRKHRESLFKEAAQLRLNHDEHEFIRIDPKRSYILDVGLMVVGEAQVKTKIRAAGKYLRATYEVRNDRTGTIFEEFRKTIKEAGVVPVDFIIYMHQYLHAEEATVLLELRVK